jgi:hypothetical protein
MPSHERPSDLEVLQYVDRPITLISRHNFDPPLTFCRPHKKDPILAAATLVIRRFSYRTFIDFCNPLFIEPLSSQDKTYLHDAASSGLPVSGVYVIHRVGLMAKVPLLLIPTSGQVMVLDQESFQDLEEWLEALPQNVCSVTGEAGFDRLWNWYKATDQIYTILNLPVELWTSIFEIAFARAVYPHPPYQPWGQGSGECVPWHPAHYRWRVPRPNISVLMLNKAVHNALRSYITNGIRKCFTHLTSLEYYKTLSDMGQFGGQLVNLELSFSLREYIYFFDADIRPFRQWKGSLDVSRYSGKASILSQLPALKCVSFDFPAPTSKDDPWGKLGPLNALGEGTDWRGNQGGHFDKWFHVSCQKTLVDWILTFAHTYLANLQASPKILLGGYVKEETRAKWEDIFEDERMGSHHDMSEWVTEIKEWPVDLLFVTFSCTSLIAADKFSRGPGCHCPLRCGSHMCAKAAGPISSHCGHRCERVIFDYEDRYIPDPMWEPQRA